IGNGLHAFCVVTNIVSPEVYSDTFRLELLPGKREAEIVIVSKLIGTTFRGRKFIETERQQYRDVQITFRPLRVRFRRAPFRRFLRFFVLFKLELLVELFRVREIALRRGMRG